MSGAPVQLVGDLLEESLVAWRVPGGVAQADGSIVVSSNNRLIRIDPAPPGSIFRWLVTIDGRKRPAISLIAVLRQVRQAIDPGYSANRVHVTVAPLVPP